jgi:hypothetical protein
MCLWSVSVISRVLRADARAQFPSTGRNQRSVGVRGGAKSGETLPGERQAPRAHPEAERELNKIVAATQRPLRPLKGGARIGLRIGKVLHRFKMAKHFSTRSGPTRRREWRALLADAAGAIDESAPAAPPRRASRTYGDDPDRGRTGRIQPSTRTLERLAQATGSRLSFASSLETGTKAPEFDEKLEAAEDVMDQLM